RAAPDLVRARHRDEERAARLVDHESVGTRHGRKEAIEAAGRREAIHASRRIVQPRLPLVGEVAVAIAVEGEVVDAPERFAVAMAEDHFPFPTGRVEPQYPLAVIRDPDAAVLVDRKAVGPAVVFGDERPTQVGRDAEDASVRDIDDVEVARAIEGG